MKRIFIFAAIALFFSLSVGAQIPNIFNAYFTIGKISPGTNDTTDIQVTQWGGMAAPNGVAAYEQEGITPGMIVWYFCDRYVVTWMGMVAVPTGVETHIKVVPTDGPYDEPLASDFRVWIVEEVVSEGGNVVAPVPPTSEITKYGTYPQAANCITAYYAKKNQWSAEAGLSYDFRNLAVNTSGGLVIYNDSVQIEPRGIHGYHINQMGATSGQALAWNGSNWQPASISGGSAPTYTVLDAGAIGDQNNWSPSGYTSTTRHIKVQPNSGVTSITGLVPLGTGNYQLTLENTGQYYCILTHEDAASTAANRFTLDAPFITLRPGGTITLSYVTNRWEVIAASAPRKTRYTNELAAFQRISGSPTTTDNFTAAGSGGGGTGTAAGSTMQVGYGGVSTSTSATGRYALSATAIPYFSDKGEVSFFRATVQPNTAAPDGTESYNITVGYVGSVDISTNPKTAAFVLGAVGTTYCGYTFLTTNWHCITYDGTGSAEVFDTGVAPAYSGTVNSTNLRELTVSLTDAGVRYWIDGVLQATHSTETTFSATLTPAVAIDKTLGTTARTCAVATLEVYFNDNF